MNRADKPYKPLQDAGNKAGLEKFHMYEHMEGLDKIDIALVMREMTKHVQLTVKEYKKVTNANFPMNNEKQVAEKLIELFGGLRHKLADVRNFCDIGIYELDEMMRAYGKVTKE